MKIVKRVAAAGLAALAGAVLSLSVPSAAQATQGGAPAAAGACGETVGPDIQFDGLNHVIVTMGFTGAKRATAYAMRAYISIENGGNTSHRFVEHDGTLFFRSSLTKRYVEEIPTSGRVYVTAYLVGTFTVASTSIACVLYGYSEGGIFQPEAL